MAIILTTTKANDNSQSMQLDIDVHPIKLDLWCLKNCKHLWFRMSDTSIWFSSNEDAVLFSLTWGGIYRGD